MKRRILFLYPKILLLFRIIESAFFESGVLLLAVSVRLTVPYHGAVDFRK
jgi:hypothetical protein